MRRARAVKRAVAEESNEILIDLQVSYIDSDALGKLVSSYTRGLRQVWM
jgi:anti-anti-sigma regulatory factor